MVYYLKNSCNNFCKTLIGMTSEGGGAVAFPVMTLMLGVAPVIARDFSWMVQAAGMNLIIVILTKCKKRILC